MIEDLATEIQELGILTETQIKAQEDLEEGMADLPDGDEVIQKTLLRIIDAVDAQGEAEVRLRLLNLSLLAEIVDINVAALCSLAAYPEALIF